jgi:hypothetical protein
MWLGAVGMDAWIDGLEGSLTVQNRVYAWSHLSKAISA